MSDALGDRGGEESSDSIRELFLDAVMGVEVGSTSHAVYFERKGLMEFCGNQWGEDWKWRRLGLMKLTTEKLQRFYKELKRKQRDKWKKDDVGEAAEDDSTPAITLPDNVLIDPFPAEDAVVPPPAEPEMWRWTNWERGGVLNGHRITVYFRVVDGVIQPDGPADRAFVPEFLKPWVGKSLAELQLWRRQTEVVGHYVGVLKRVGEF